jgi:tetratricopeptide (TPR) repeat protein
MNRAKHRPTESPDAHLTHMRGVSSLYLWTKAGAEEALRLAYQAVKIDPDYSSAYGLAATCYAVMKSAGWQTDPVKAVAEVEVLAERGAVAGRDDAWALGACGFAVANILGDLDRAKGLIDRALSINANFALIWTQSAYLRAWLGEPDLAIAHVERAKRLSPVDPHMFTMEGATAHDEAFASAETALRQNPFFPQGTRVAVASAAHLERTEDAKKYLARLQMLDADLRVSNLRDRITFRRPDDFERLAEGLRKAGVPT